jgi:hypothetical protein
MNIMKDVASIKREQDEQKDGQVKLVMKTKQEILT